jgi:hypothetical protein
VRYLVSGLYVAACLNAVQAESVTLETLQNQFCGAYLFAQHTSLILSSLDYKVYCVCEAVGVGVTVCLSFHLQPHTLPRAQITYSAGHQWRAEATRVYRLRARDPSSHSLPRRTHFRYLLFMLFH